MVCMQNEQNFARIIGQKTAINRIKLISDAKKKNKKKMLSAKQATFRQRNTISFIRSVVWYLSRHAINGKLNTMQTEISIADVVWAVANIVFCCCCKDWVSMSSEWSSDFNDFLRFATSIDPIYQ